MRRPASFLLSCLIACVVACVCIGGCMVAFTIFIQCASAQDAPIPARIVSAIHPTDMVTLRGNVHPLARADYDQGPLPDAQPLHRMLLLLQRGPDQEKALRKLLDDQQSKFSPNFHAWLTPQQFGAQFGPAPSDLQTVTTWLQAQGFQINRVSAGMMVIEFDGTAGQVRNAFQTQMHRYLVNGQERNANANDPRIPAALAPVVAGVVSLHNFPAQSHLLKIGAFRHGSKTGAPLPLYTPNGSTDNFPLVPADFASIYNVAPLWTAGIDGTGQTIAIVGQSQIDVNDVQNFRALFGLSNNFTSANIIVDGIDPGIVDGDETESDLDVEWSGAVAKNATIEFVIAGSTETTGGAHLSALYIVDHNVAPVLSESYGTCETSLGTTNNQYYNALWEQAAAQGITVILSAGDGGSAGCDDFNAQVPASQGLAVSGYASTPFNVAVGGTDFDQINKWQQFWSPTDDPVTLGSALGYIPEIPWNDSCAQLGLTGCGSSQVGGNLMNIVAGSGGPSSLYSKPSWQSGAGVPQDNKRDIPDVSLFASNGFTGSGYLICANDQGGFCQSGTQFFSYLAIGGTSASAPAFAGIMGLINHSQANQSLSNRQGNANYILYALAKKQANITPALNCNASASPVAACTFNDVTRGNSFFTNSVTGTNSVACLGASPNCSATIASQTGALIAPGAATPKVLAWTTNPSYDLAVGLGSVNAQNLATNWKSANATATTTTLTLNGGAAVNITHGAPASVSIGVTPTAAIGDVALVGTLANNDTVGMVRFTLANGTASGTTSNLAGGTYKVTAHYEGDGTNAPSDSAAVTVTVAPENSKTFVTVPTFDPNTGRETSSAATTLVYGSPYLLRADVTNSSGSLALLCTSATIPVCPSGSVAVTDSVNGASAKPVDAGTFVLNSAGSAEDQTVQLASGSHVLTVHYSGDNSYLTSTSAPYSLSVTSAPTSLNFSSISEPPVVGQPFALTTELITSVFNGAAPTGTVTFYDGATPLPGAVTTNGVAGSPAYLTASSINTVTTGGPHTFSVKYGGDANYAASNATAASVVALYPTTGNVTLSSQNIIYGATVTATGTLSTSVKAPALTGRVTFYTPFQGNVAPATLTTGTDANGNTQITATLDFMPTYSESITVNYDSDPNFTLLSSQGSFVQVTTPDFTVGAPSALIVTAGQTGTAALTITPTSNLASTVNLSCTGNAPVGSVCTITPAMVSLTGGKSAMATISITSIAPSGSMAIANPQRRSLIRFDSDSNRNSWWGASFVAGVMALCLVLMSLQRPSRHRVLAAAGVAGLFCVVSFVVGCGGGGGSSPPPPPPPQRATTTTVLTTNTPKVAAGTPANFIATVTSSNTVTGTVTFSGGNYSSGPVAVVGDVAQGQIVNLPLGTIPVQAMYSGDANNLSSTSAAFNQVSTGTTQLQVSAQTGGTTHASTLTVTLQ